MNLMMNNKNWIISKPQSVNRFYFLDYFYVLLKSVENYSNIDKVFDSFKIMKQKYQLGESKYKKLTIETVGCPGECDQNNEESCGTWLKRLCENALTIPI